ncbi:MAG: type IX secretion system sortase PorU [Bacteroidales bacterium]|nr:type IX secretion system sortase PorU [Bacteroidales bacterium]
MSLAKLSAQTIELSRTIEWEPNIKSTQFKDKNEQIYQYFNFRNADFNFRDDFLPVYTELIPIPDNHFKISIKDISLLALDEKESFLVSRKISEDLNFQSKIFFIRKKPYLSITVFPFKKQNGKIYKFKSFKIELTPYEQKNINKFKKRYANNSVLATGNWIKIKLKKSGVYKISFEELKNAGINNPENIRIFGNGGAMLSFYNNTEQIDDLKEIDIQIKDNAVLFYAPGPIHWEYDSINKIFMQKLHLYSDYAYYFLTDDYNSGKDNTIKPEQQSTASATKTITSFNDFAYHEIDSINLLLSGRLWVNELFDYQTEYTFDFNFPNMISGSEIKLNTSLLARSPVSSSFSIRIQNSSFTTTFPAVSYNYIATYAAQKKELYRTISNGGNELSVNIIYNKSTASAKAWLDYITLNVERLLKFTGQQMPFQSIESVATGAVSEFIISGAGTDVTIWNISDFSHPKIVSADYSTNTIRFKLATDSLLRFIAFDGSDFLSPEFEGNDVGKIANQNLHGINRGDMIIISPPEFLTYARQLKNLHEERDGLIVHLISTEQVYNEFSSGAPDVSAIRNFIKMLYDRANNSEEIPKYLLLFGDGSFDNRHQFQGNTNFIPTYQSENSLSPTQSFVTDDFFGLLDDNEGGSSGLVDIGIGRLPVKNNSEAQTAVNKIKMYLDLQSMGEWRNKICFIADDEDNALHMWQADQLTQQVRYNYPVFNIDKIYLDAYKQESSSLGQRYPEVNKAIDDNISRGVLLINYTGHGGESGLAEERIITVDQINKWVNPYKLFVFMTATCEFSRFDNYKMTTAGEYVFLNKNGGAVALFSTTRLVYASPNFFLNKNFYKYVFEKNTVSGKKYRLGDIMRLTKNASGSGINKRNFTLLGDPALPLSYAQQNIITTSVKNNTTNHVTDTLKAFDKITIEGIIQDPNGQADNQFNGLVFPSIFDKFKLIKTLDNDGEGVFEYHTQNSKIFKGKASVSGGKFKFSFIVPKDIKYNIDTGKISYYAFNAQSGKDAFGYDKSIFIGSTSNSGYTDKAGPKIKLYLNDESFVSGGITDNNPLILAFVEDESGINTTGSGIGHDISAIIDDDPNMQFKLNDFYESETDNFTKGSIKYPLNNLSPGEHKLSLKVWDVYNNSSQDSILFTVADAGEFKIAHVLNFPNPFSTHTSFFFEHNRPNQLLTILIQIFSVNGRIVKSIHTETITQGYRIKGIPWDGKDDFGNKIGRGVYFYKISVRTENNEYANYTEKLLIF